MGTIKDAADTTYRDYITAGVPSSGDWEPQKSEIRSLFALIEAAVGQVGLAGVADVVKDTRANLDADLAHPAGTVALTYADAVDANNDFSIKTGASGSGGWTLTTILHDSVGNAAQPYLEAAEAAVDLANAAAAAANSAVALSQPGLTTIRKDDFSYRAPVLQWSPSRFGDRTWFNGAYADIDDVAPVRTGTQSAAGGRKLATVPALPGGFTVYVRYRKTAPENQAGALWDGATADNGTLPNEIGVTTGVTSGASVPTVPRFDFVNKQRNPNVTTLTQNRFGAERLIYSVPASGQARRWVEGGEIVVESTIGTYVAPTHFSIAARLIAGVSGSAQALANSEILDFLIFDEGMSATEIERLIDATDPDVDLPLDNPWPDMPRTYDATGKVVYPAAWYNPANGRGWWNGRKKTAAELFVDPANGNFTLKKMPRVLAAAGMTVFHDGAPVALYGSGNRPSGTAFWSGYAGDSGVNSGRLILEVATTGYNPASPGLLNGFFQAKGYSSARANFYDISRPNPPSIAAYVGANTDIARGHGVNRVIVTELPNGNLRASINFHGRTDFTNGTANVFIPKDLGRIGAVWNGTAPIANYPQQSVGIFARALTESEHTILQAWNPSNIAPKIVSGDSGRNAHQLEESYVMRAAARGITHYIPRASYGTGGKGIWFHRDFWVAAIAWRPELSFGTLIMFEMGLDQTGPNLTNTATVTLANPLEILPIWREIGGLFKRPPIWVQSNYNKSVVQLEGNPTHQPFIDELAWVRGGNDVIRRAAPDHFCEIMPAVQTGELNWAEYQSLVARDAWPKRFFLQSGGVVTDTIHPFWPTGTDFTTSAYYHIGDAIALKLFAVDDFTTTWIPSS